MNSLKKGETVPLLNFGGCPGVPPLNFKSIPGPYLNFEGGLGYRGPGFTSKSCRNGHFFGNIRLALNNLLWYFFETLLTLCDFATLDFHLKRHLKNSVY